MNAEHQRKVGGSLSIYYEIIGKPVVNATSFRTDASEEIIPNYLWNMIRPALRLTIVKASELPRADIFGSSDPIAMIFIGN